MPTVRLDLGRYVTVRPRKDGTARVLFEVPARLRPSGWSPAIPLPVTGERHGDLTDASEVARIQADAARLLRDLYAGRMGRTVDPKPRSMPALNRSWQSTQRFKDKSPRTQAGYAYHAGLIEAWSASVGHPPVERLKLEPIEQFLAFYDDRPTTRRHLKVVFKMLMDRAIQLEWRTTNPLDTVKMSAPETTVTIWEAADVLAGVWACIMAGQTPVAALILTEWEIGQRITDARRFRRNAEYSVADRAFRFWQQKTNSYVTIPVSDRCADLIGCVQDDDSLYLFTDRATGKPFAEQRLSHVWDDIRDAFGLNPSLQLRGLRHSCVVQLARAGADIPEIASITGHTLKSVHQILQRYLPADNKLAWSAQAKRGLISSALTVRLA